MTGNEIGAIGGRSVRWDAQTGEVWVNVQGLFAALWIKVGHAAPTAFVARQQAKAYLDRR